MGNICRGDGTIRNGELCSPENIRSQRIILENNLCITFPIGGKIATKPQRRKLWLKIMCHLRARHPIMILSAVCRANWKKGNYGKDHWLVGKGFEENALAQKTSPEAYVLNEISDSVPVVIISKDETVACANTIALTKMNVEHKKGIVDKNSIKDLKNAIK